MLPWQPSEWWCMCTSWQRCPALSRAAPPIFGDRPVIALQLWWTLLCWRCRPCFQPGPPSLKTDSPHNHRFFSSLALACRVWWPARRSLPLPPSRTGRWWGRCWKWWSIYCTGLMRWSMDSLLFSPGRPAWSLSVGCCWLGCWRIGRLLGFFWGLLYWGRYTSSARPAAASSPRRP